MPITLPSYTVSDRQGIHAVYHNAQTLAEEGFGVIDGCSVFRDNGDLGQPGTVGVNSGTLLYDGEPVNVSSSALTLATSDTNPRWDLIYYGDSGLDVMQGVPEPADPESAQRTDTLRPAPPDLKNDPSTGSPLTERLTPLAIVWVEANASSVVTADIENIRMSADIWANYGHYQELQVATAASSPDDVVKYNQFTGHTSAQSNPHNVTAEQVDSIPTTGGTMTGGLTIEGDITVEDGASLGGHVRVEDGSDGLVFAHYDNDSDRFYMRYPDDDEGIDDFHDGEFGFRFESVSADASVFFAHFEDEEWDFNYIPHVRGDEIWHEGHFHPDDKLDTTGGSISGGLTVDGALIAMDDLSVTGALDAGSVDSTGEITSSSRIIAENASGADDGVQIGDLEDNHISIHEDRLTFYSDEDDGWGFRTGDDMQAGYEWQAQINHDGDAWFAGDVEADGDVAADGDVHVGRFAEFEPHSSTPSNPPQYGIWFVEDTEP